MRGHLGDALEVGDVLGAVKDAALALRGGGLRPSWTAPSCAAERLVSGRWGDPLVVAIEQRAHRTRDQFGRPFVLVPDTPGGSVWPPLHAEGEHADRRHGHLWITGISLAASCAVTRPPS